MQVSLLSTFVFLSYNSQVFVIIVKIIHRWVHREARVMNYGTKPDIASNYVIEK